MNRTRRQVVALGACGVAGILSGCVTSALFKASSYSEEVSSVLISEDDTKLVVIGRDYHYIFDAPEILVKTLKAGFHKAVFAVMEPFAVDASGTVKGALTLRVAPQTSDQARQDALALGYTKNPLTGDSYVSQYRLELNGRRYKAGGIQPKSASQKLNRTYSVFVAVAPSAAETAGKILLTPVTVGIDGVLILGAIPLVLIGVTALTISVSSMCHDKPDCFK